MTWAEFNLASRIQRQFGKRIVSLAPAGGTPPQPHVAVTYIKEGAEVCETTRIYRLELGKLKEVTDVPSAGV